MITIEQLLAMPLMYLAVGYRVMCYGDSKPNGFGFHPVTTITLWPYVILVKVIQWIKRR